MKIKFEFIVDCSKNTPNERQEVYKWLINERGYNNLYEYNNYPIIVSNFFPGQTNYLSLQCALKDYPNHKILTYEEFLILKDNKRPPSWCIKVDKENQDILKKHYLKHDYFFKIDNYIFIEDNQLVDWNYSPSLGGFKYPQITTDQFLNLIQKKYNNNMKKGDIVTVPRQLLDEGYKYLSSHQKEKIHDMVNGFTGETTVNFIMEFRENVCKEWKQRITDAFPNIFREVDLDKELVENKRGHFGDSLANSLITVRRFEDSKQHHIGYALNNIYDWELVEDSYSKGMQILVPKRQIK